MAEQNASQSLVNNSPVQKLFDLVETGTAHEVEVHLGEYFPTSESILRLRRENNGTLLHCASSREEEEENGTEIVKLILDRALSPGMDESNLAFLNMKNGDQISALQMALENGNDEVVRLLLESLSKYEDTTEAMGMIGQKNPSLYDALKKEMIQKLFDAIKSGTVENARDQIYANISTPQALMRLKDNGRTILHCACERGDTAMEVVQLILDKAEHSLQMGNEAIRGFIDLPYTPTNVTVEQTNSKDSRRPLRTVAPENKYAINIAIDKEDVELVRLLIFNGADVNLPKNKHNEAIRLIYKKFPEIITDVFESNLKWTSAPKNTSIKMRTITWDFTPVTGCLKHDLEENANNKFANLEGQTQLLAPALHRNEAERAEVLLHPLVQIFLHYKYEKFWLFIAISMLYHVLWSAASISFIIYICFPEAFGWRNATLTNLTQSTSEQDGLPQSKWKISPTSLDIIILFGIFWVLTFAKEITEIGLSPSWRYYRSQLENWGQWLLLISLVFVLFWPWLRNSFAALGMFSAGVLTLGQLNKTVWFGIYMEILGKVTWNILKFFIFFCPLIITYAGILNLLLPDSDAFFFPWVAAKVVTMMTGEVGYDELFHPDEAKKVPPLPHPHVAKLVILLFDFTVIIVLQNLLISLTISDIPALKEEAKLDHCSMKLEQIYLIEKFLLLKPVKSCCCCCKKLLEGLMVKPKSKPGRRLHHLPKEVQEVLKAAFKDPANPERFKNKDPQKECDIYVKPGCWESFKAKYCKCFKTTTSVIASNAMI